MSNSTNLALPFLTLGQAQKHVTVNESLLRLDALVQMNVVSATTGAQPGSPADGALYILPAGKTGAAWAAMSNYALAYYRDGIWEQLSPSEGWLAFVKDADQLLYYTGAAWSLFPSANIVTVSATDKVLGRVSSGAGAAEEVAFTDQAQQLCDDTSFGAMRTTLGAAGLADANTFTVAQLIQTSTNAPLTLQYDNNGAAIGPIFDFIRNSTSPAASDVMGAFRFVGYDSAAVSTVYALIQAEIVDPTDGSEDGLLNVMTRIGGVAASTRLTFGAGLYHPSATGGDKGNNTINFGAVYDDNTLLTCFVLEYARTGALDLALWDSTAPRGYHAAAHRFWGQRELLEVDAYTAYWKEYGHLPGLPSREEWAEHARDKKPVGEMISRLWQTVEMQAVHIAQLSDEIKALRA